MAQPNRLIGNPDDAEIITELKKLVIERITENCGCSNCILGRSIIQYLASVGK